MNEYVDITFKNHKKFNKKILFIIFKECSMDDRKKVDEIITEYVKIIKENTDLSIIVDGRNIQKVDKTMGFQKATELDKYRDLVHKNVISMAILLENPVLKFLLDSITKIHPYVVPTIVCNENKEAMDHIVSQFK